MAEAEYAVSGHPEASPYGIHSLLSRGLKHIHVKPVLPRWLAWKGRAEVFHIKRGRSFFPGPIGSQEEVHIH